MGRSPKTKRRSTDRDQIANQDAKQFDDRVMRYVGWWLLLQVFVLFSGLKLIDYRAAYVREHGVAPYYFRLQIWFLIWSALFIGVVWLVNRIRRRHKV